MEITNEQLQSRIVLLTKCIEFYADGNNYKKDDNSGNSQIELDAGTIAKHTLAILTKLKETDDELEAVFNALQGEIGAEETMNMIKELTEKYKNNNGGQSI